MKWRYCHAGMLATSVDRGRRFRFVTFAAGHDLWVGCGYRQLNPPRMGSFVLFAPCLWVAVRCSPGTPLFGYSAPGVWARST
jgi:hypothetical protein